MSDIVQRLLDPSELSTDLAHNQLHFDAADTIKRLRERVMQSASHTPTYIDPNYLMIEQLLNIITQYEDNMPKWMRESDNA